MKILYTGIVLGVCVASSSGATAAKHDIPFTSDRWELKNATVVEHLGRTSLCGTAFLKDAVFGDGVIEVDVAVTGARSYPGIVFRMQSEEEGERFYLRPHRAGMYPDALHYTPICNGVTCWQLYHGEGYTAPADIPANQWIPLRMEIKGQQGRVFLGATEEPALVIHELQHGSPQGWQGVMSPNDGTAFFSNFRYRQDESLQFAEPPPVHTPEGMLMEWEVSRPYPADRVDRTRYPEFFQVFYAQWQPVEADKSGLVNISRKIKRPDEKAHCVFARTVVDCAQAEDVQLAFGYSDVVTVYLNGQPVFSGNSAYRSRDRSFLGLVGLHDMVYLPMRRGLNEICLLVAESFGGWGFMCHADKPLRQPVKRHDLLTKVWETPAELEIPESVLYDAAREILYVTSFNKVGANRDHVGFISKVTLDGQIAERDWITGLDGPCGMGLHGDKLYVVECSGHLVEINIEAGQVTARYPTPGFQFLNDLVVDESGTVYITNSSRERADKDIFAVKDGVCTVWREGDDLHRSNGLFLYDGGLLVGSTGDGCLKRVDLQTGALRTVVSLGAGVVDGIRVDGAGNYLVSRWEGQVYRVSPSGNIVEILDTMSAGSNTADFEFIKDQDLLIIPTFMGNTVAAYKLQNG